MEQSQGYLIGALMAYWLQVRVGVPPATSPRASCATRAPSCPCCSRSRRPPRSSTAPRRPFARIASGSSPRRGAMGSRLSSRIGRRSLVRRDGRAREHVRIVPRHALALPPRPDFGTIEVHIMDAQPTLNQSLALAALVHSLLVHLASSNEFDGALWTFALVDRKRKRVSSFARRRSRRISSATPKGR